MLLLPAGNGGVMLWHHGAFVPFSWAQHCVSPTDPKVPRSSTVSIRCTRQKSSPSNNIQGKRVCVITVRLLLLPLTNDIYLVLLSMPAGLCYRFPRSVLLVWMLRLIKSRSRVYSFLLLCAVLFETEYLDGKFSFRLEFRSGDSQGHCLWSDQFSCTPVNRFESYSNRNIVPIRETSIFEVE